MTVQNTGNRAPYTGDGASTAFSYPYKFLKATDLKVYANGLLATLTTDYSVGTPTDTGALVTFNVAPAVGVPIVIIGDPDHLQQSSLPSTGPFPAKTVETMSDKLTLIVQRLYDLVSRSLTLNDSDTTTGSTALPSFKASNLLGWGPDASSGLQNVDPTSLATIVAFGTARSDLFNGDGSTKTFPLSANPGALNNLDVTVSGVPQRNGIDFTWSGGTSLVFTTAPPAGTQNVFVRYMQGLPQGSTDSAASTFIQAGGNAVTRSAQDKMRDIVAVTDFSGSDLGVQISNAIASLPATGGVVDMRMLTGAQVITSKVSVTKPGVVLLTGSATYTLSGVLPTQSPFGAQFLITVPNFWVFGNGATIFKMAAGAQANAFGFLHGATKGGLAFVELDGNKANNSGQVDDTFQSGVQIISAAAGGATVDSRITLHDCDIHDFIHYGVVTYGDLSGGNDLRNSRIHDNGKTGDALSTGDGVYINKGSSRNLLTGVRSYGNKRSGIRYSTAGVAHVGNKQVDCWTYSNGLHGIFVDEELNTGSVSGVGQSGLVLRGNHSYSNAGDGLRLGTYDSVGFIANYTVEGNHFYGNTGYGALFQGNSHASNNTRLGLVANNQAYGNGLDGLAVAVNVLDTTVSNNTSVNNTGASISDAGTRTLKVANKDSITAPVWYEQGSWTPTDGSGAGLTLTVAAATFVKIGKMVYATFALTFPSTASGATARIGGLPYTSQNSGVSMHPVSISFTNKSGLLSGVVDGNAKTFTFTSTTGVTLNNVDLSTSIVRGTAIYEVA